MSGYEEVEKQISLENFWKAKEILQGRLANSTYDVDLYEQYGLLLLQMKDEMEAGKFLFLSGVRRPEYEKSIYLYLNRYGGKATSGLFHTFPHSAQVSSVTDFPAIVLKELEKSGHKQSVLQSNARPKTPESEKSDKFSYVVGFAGVVGFCLIVIGLVVQGVRGTAWLVNSVFTWFA